MSHYREIQDYLQKEVDENLRQVFIDLWFLWPRDGDADDFEAIFTNLVQTLRVFYPKTDEWPTEDLVECIRTWLEYMRDPDDDGEPLH